MSESTPVRPGRPSRRLRFSVTVVLLAGLGLVVWWRLRPAEHPQGVSAEDYKTAERKFLALYRRKPDRGDVLSLAAELAVQEGRLPTAVACFHAIPSTTRRYGLAARLQEGQVLLQLNRARDAEQNFQELLARADDMTVQEDQVIAAAKRLGYILSVELRFEERRALLAQVHARGQADLFDSKQYFFPSLLIWHSSTGRHRLTEFLEQDPENSLLITARGRYLTAEGRLTEARELLDEQRRQGSDDLRCTAALLECLFETSVWPGFIELAETLPAYEIGESWLLTRMRGEFDLYERRWENAARHFELVLEKDPADPACHMGLARAYAELQRPHDRDEIQRRALILARIRVNLVNVNDGDYDAVVELAGACEKIGFSEAAQTFGQHALRIERASRGGT